LSRNTPCTASRLVQCAARNAATPISPQSGADPCFSPFCEYAIPIGHEIRFVEEHAFDQFGVHMAIRTINPFALRKNFLQHQSTRRLKINKIERCELWLAHAQPSRTGYPALSLDAWPVVVRFIAHLQDGTRLYTSSNRTISSSPR